MMSERARVALVEQRLGDGRIICALCGATLADVADRCASDIGAACPGFVAIDAASQEREPKEWAWS